MAGELQGGRHGCAADVEFGEAPVLFQIALSVPAFLVLCDCWASSLMHDVVSLAPAGKARVWLFVPP